MKCNCKIWKLGRCVRQEIGDRWRFLSTWFLKYISLNLESAMAEKLSNQTELWPGKWAMERQYGAPVAYRERQVMATLSWHKIGGHVTDRGWILNDKLTFILDQSKPYYWMIIQRWIHSRGRWRPLWHCLHWPVVGRESDSLQLLHKIIALLCIYRISVHWIPRHPVWFHCITLYHIPFLCITRIIQARTPAP